MIDISQKFRWETVLAGYNSDKNSIFFADKVATQSNTEETWRYQVAFANDFRQWTSEQNYIAYLKTLPLWQDIARKYVDLGITRFTPKTFGNQVLVFDFRTSTDGPPNSQTIELEVKFEPSIEPIFAWRAWKFNQTIPASSRYKNMEGYAYIGLGSDIFSGYRPNDINDTGTVFWTVIWLDITAIGAFPFAYADDFFFALFGLITSYDTKEWDPTKYILYEVE